MEISCEAASWTISGYTFAVSRLGDIRRGFGVGCQQNDVLLSIVHSWLRGPRSPSISGVPFNNAVPDVIPGCLIMAQILVSRAD